MLPCPRGGHNICKFLESNPTLVAAASLNSGRLSPSLGHTRGPVKEILSLAGPILAKFHLEGSWVVFWSHKHSSLSLFSRFLAENSLTGLIRISLISGKIAYTLSKNWFWTFTANLHAAGCHVNLSAQFSRVKRYILCKLAVKVQRQFLDKV